MEIIVHGSGIWPPVKVRDDGAGQIWLDQDDSEGAIIVDPADLDALIAALQAAKEQANG